MVMNRIVQRFYSKPISCQNQATFTQIIDSESKHSSQEAYHISAVLLVQMHEHFGVRGASENMTAFYQIGSQAFVIVNFSVEDNVHATIFVNHRLITAGR